MSWGDLARRPTRQAPRQLDRPVITQNLLEEYFHLKDQVKRLEAMRQHLLELLEAGALVQPGRLDVRLNVFVQRRLTAATLIPVLGEEEVEALKDQVAPTECRHVIVTDAYGASWSE